MFEKIPANKLTLKEALLLSEEIMRNIELNEIPLTNIALKTARLARLMNDFQMAELLRYETSGYPVDLTGWVDHDLWEIAIDAGREYQREDYEDRVCTESIEQLEQELKITEIALSAAKDPDISFSFANPNQRINIPSGNSKKRAELRNSNVLMSKRLASRRSLIYDYVINIYYQLKFSGISDDIFTRIRENVDKKISKILPISVKRFSAVYENLQSENPEDWSNAVHSCRRILKDLADVVYPPRENKITNVNGEEKTIHLGKEHFLNRILTFIQENSTSERFSDIVGSHLKYIEDRLKSVLKATNKGTHETIVSREEADRYVVFTYLLIGDIISLKKAKLKNIQSHKFL